MYEHVQRILRQQHIELPVWRIMVLSTEDPVAARWARDRARGAHSDQRSSTSFVDDDFIEDAYIYRNL